MATGVSLMQPESTRRCNNCGEVKPLEAFPINARCHGGRRPRCQACVNGQAREAAKARWLRDPEGMRKRKRELYAKNREVEHARMASWKQANPEHLIKSRLSAERPGLKRTLYSEVTDEAARYGLLLIKDPCSYCGGPGGEIDHIVPLRDGGTNDWDNLTSSCRSCNRRKNDSPILDALMRVYIARLQNEWGSRGLG